MNATLRLLGILVAGAVALAFVPQLVRDRVQADGRLTTSDGDTVEISGAMRAAGAALRRRRWRPPTASGSVRRSRGRGPRRRG